MVRERSKRRAVGRVVGVTAWLALVALFLLWQTATYWGFMSLIGEWQFNHFGRHYPTFNYLLLVFLLGLPGFLFFARPRGRGSDRDRATGLFRSAETFLRAFLWTGAALGAAALMVMVAMLFLPRESGEAQRIDLSRPVMTPPREGPTVLSGDILYQRTAGFDDDLLLARRSFRFAPVVGRQDEEGHVRFFVQFPPADERTRGGAAVMTGVLRRDGLPGEVLRLFRYAGFEVDDPHYVLFVEPSAMRWPYLTGIAQLVVGALLALLFGLLQRRRITRARRAASDAPPAAAAG